MSDSSKSYKSILKGTALFGGVQVFNVLINLIRGKLIAILLGPEGMGISSLLFTSMNTVQQFTSMGLNLSAVREISSAKDNSSKNVLEIVVAVRKLLLFTSLLGGFITIIFCEKISIWTFGNNEYRYHFALLSLFIIFTTLSNGELAILQGVHATKKLAYSSIVGSLSGLLIGVPLYYFFGYDGISPAMIILSLSIYLFYRYSTNIIFSNSKIKIPWNKLFPLFKQLASLGIVMMASTLLGTLVIYILNMIIRYNGSIEDVGLYQAANSITNQYIGIVFTAMSLDFFPRLSAVSNNNERVRELVNQQSEIVLLIIAPLSILFIICSPLIIRILLSEKFIELIPVIKLMGLGILFKAFAFPMGYISFSKGDKKVFFWLEGIFGNILMLALNALLYKFYGMLGIGIAFILTYMIISIVYVILTKKIYNFYHNKKVLFLLIIYSIMVVLSFLISYMPDNYLSYFITIAIFLITSFFSLKELNNRVHFFSKR